MTADRYDDAVDLSLQNDSHAMVGRAVAPGSRVLDLGCATGRLAAALVERGCEVVGVEADPASAAVARDRGLTVLELDLDRVDDELDGLGVFDVVICADVLEHLKQPERLLRLVGERLRPETGYLVASIPNVAHGSVRLALLSGAFPYERTGLLDDTHLRFYTPESMPDLLRAGGFEPLFVDAVRLEPLHGSTLEKVDVDTLPPAAVQAVRDDPRAWDYQLIVVAQPAPIAESGPLRLLARAQEELTSTRTELREARRTFAVDDGPEVLRQLTESAVRAEARDVLSSQRLTAAEAALVAATDQLATRERELQEAAAANAAAAERVAVVEQTLTAIYGSRLWKAGLAYRGVVERVRRAR